LKYCFSSIAQTHPGKNFVFQEQWIVLNRWEHRDMSTISYLNDLRMKENLQMKDLEGSSMVLFSLNLMSD
jgi:hypothetical protein